MLAERYRGVTLFQGHEYIDEEPAWELADQILASGDWRNAQSPQVGALSPTVEPPDERAGQAIIGVDERFIVRANNLFPYSPQVLWRLINGGSIGTCSATMIGPQTAVSAAHCIHTGSGWRPGASSFSPGVDAQDPNPFPYGSFCAAVTILGGFAGGDTDAEHDFAVINFAACNQYPGNLSGWLGVWAAGSNQLESQIFNIYGYASESCPGGNCFWPSIWGGVSNWSGARNSEELHYWTDTTGGQSGSGVYMYYGGGAYVIGTHKGSTGGVNWGKRMTLGLLGFLETYSPWRRHPSFPGGYPSQFSY